MIFIMICVTRFFNIGFLLLKKEETIGNKETVQIWCSMTVIFCHHFVGFSFAKGRQSCSRCADLSDLDLGVGSGLGCEDVRLLG